MGQGDGCAAERDGGTGDATERRSAMKRALGLTVLAAVVAVGISCGGKDSMTSGPATLTSAAAGTGLRLFQQSLGGTSTKFALIGQLNTGTTILTIGVQDISALSQYSGTINGVAQPNFQLRPLGGYALALTR